MGTHQDRKLLANPLQATKAVVLGQCRQKVLQNLALASSTSDVSELLRDLELIRARERGGIKEGDELRVALENTA